MNKIYYIIILLLVNISFSAIPLSVEGMLSSKPYITGEDGVIRMSVNIIGHVKKPGTFVVYDGMDLLTLLSLSGGPLAGANLKKVLIKHYDGSIDIVNLNKVMFNKTSSPNSEFKLKPRDTVFINQKMFSKLITSSNLPTIFLSILNIALTLERTQD